MEPSASTDTTTNRTFDTLGKKPLRKKNVFVMVCVLCVITYSLFYSNSYTNMLTYVPGSASQQKQINEGADRTVLPTSKKDTSTPVLHDDIALQTMKIIKANRTVLPTNKSVHASAPTVNTATVPTISIPSPPVVAAAAVLASNTNSGSGNDATSDASSPLSIMLQKAGLSKISQADLARLPTLAQWTRQYGNVQSGPVIIGMDSCERYRQQVKQRRRYAAPAGMYNTGTNALFFHLKHNLQAAQKYEVPWGKHLMESLRLTHTDPSMKMVDKQDAMPIVMIRDPLHWMQSMVRDVKLLLYIGL
jgi:hypothetical protein